MSPDGETIAYLGYDDEVLSYQQTDLYVMDIDGSNARNLTADYDRSIDDIAWRDDAILVMSEMDGDIVINEISLRGRVTQLQDGVGGTSIGRPYAGGSFSVASQNGSIAYTAASPDTPAEVGFNDGRSSRKLTALNDDLLPHLDMAPIEESRLHHLMMVARSRHGWPYPTVLRPMAATR